MRRVEQRPVFHPNLNEALRIEIADRVSQPSNPEGDPAGDRLTEQICLQLDAGDYGDSRSFGANARSRTAPRSADTTLKTGGPSRGGGLRFLGDYGFGRSLCRMLKREMWNSSTATPRFLAASSASRQRSVE